MKERTLLNVTQSDDQVNIGGEIKTFVDFATLLRVFTTIIARSEDTYEASMKCILACFVDMVEKKEITADQARDMLDYMHNISHDGKILLSPYGSEPDNDNPREPIIKPVPFSVNTSIKN